MTFRVEGWFDGSSGDCEPPEPGKYWLAIVDGDDPVREEWAIIVHRTDDFSIDDPNLIEKEKRAAKITDLLNADNEGLLWRGRTPDPGH